MSKNTFFQKKVSFLVLANFRWNHYFYNFSWFTLFWAKKFLAKTDSVHENAFFSLPDTNRVRQLLQKKQFFDFSHFWMTTLKKHYFYGFFLAFSIFIFLFSVYISPT